MQPFKVLRGIALALLVLFCIVPGVRGRSWAVYVRRGAASEGAAVQPNSASGMFDFYGKHASVGQWPARSLRQVATAQPPREAPSTSQNPQKVVCDTSAECVEHYESMFLWCTPEKVCNACGGPGGPCCTEELGDYPYTTPCVDGSSCLANTSRCAGDAEPGVPCRTNEDCAELPRTFCNMDVNYCNACDAAEDPPEVCRDDGRGSMDEDWPAERIAAVVTPVVLALFLVLLAVVCVGKRFQAQHRKDKHALSRAAAAAAAATAATQGGDFQVRPSAASPPSYVTSSRDTAERLLPEALPTPSATASSPASELGASSLGPAAVGGGAAAAHPPAQRTEGNQEAAGQDGASDGAASRSAGGEGGGAAEGRDGGSAAKPVAGPQPWGPDTGLRPEEVEMGSPSGLQPVGTLVLQPQRPPLHPPSISRAHSSHAQQQPTLAEKLQEAQESAAADSARPSSSGAGSCSVEPVDGSLAAERHVVITSASVPANGQAAGHGDSSSQASGGRNAYDARLEGLMVMARLMPPLPDVDMNVDPQTDLSFQRVIGRGAYGVVYEGFWTARDGSRRHVAIKTLKPSAMAGGERQKMLDSLQREIDIMTRIDHKGIVRCYGGCIRDNMVCVLLEMMNGGTLSNYVHQVRARTQPLSVREVLSAALQLSSALAHLHPLVVHADIKPLNLLLDNEGTLKVADFGLSKYKYNTMLTSLHGGTLAYTAPEVLANAQVNEKCDIYSLGMVLWECLASELPWSQIQIHFQIYHEVVNSKNRPQIPAHCPRKLKSIIESCWHHDPVLRPSAFEVYRQVEVLLASLPTDE